MLGITIGIILCVVGAIMIFFSVPYSIAKSRFANLTQEVLANAKEESEVFREEDLVGLPELVQNYIRKCGYIGKPKMSYMKAEFHNTTFSLGQNKPYIKIDYTQYNVVAQPDRIAYIDSSMYGIPFEGIDAYQDGKGSMTGMLGKLVTLFHQTGEAMDKASLVTFLAESLVVPNAVLQDYITWEEIDSTHVKATITYQGVSGSGIFTFNEAGEVTTFTTNDRQATTFDGEVKQVPWTAVYGEYQVSNGINLPTIFQAIWNFEEGDLLYFDGQGTKITFGQ